VLSMEANRRSRSEPLFVIARDAGCGRSSRLQPNKDAPVARTSSAISPVRRTGPMELEIRSALPHRKQDYRQLPCERNPGASGAGALAQRQIPPLERAIRGSLSKDHGRNDQVGPRQLVPILRNPRGPRLHAGLVASRRQAEIGADMACKPEARRIVDRRVERYRADRPHAGDLHQQTAHRMRSRGFCEARIEFPQIGPEALAQVYQWLEVGFERARLRFAERCELALDELSQLPGGAPWRQNQPMAAEP